MLSCFGKSSGRDENSEALTRAFNETPMNARKCRPILCKLLYLLQHGETIGKTEATDTFFAITKLWQAKDMTLRMLVYLSIKELCQMSSDVIIVTSSEISDESKIVVIEAIRSLCHRYPRKYATLMNFLVSMLRDEGGFDYKKAIVDTIITIVEDNPSAKDLGLSHFCEFIEDCEHAALATRVLHLLGREGPTTANPSRYIRFIYNRVILESTQLEHVDVGLADFLLATAPKGASFTTAWDALKEEGHETEESYALSNVHTLEDAVSKLLKCTALFPCEHSNRVPEGKSSHQLLLCGIFRGGIDVLCRVRLVMDPSDQTVSMNMIVRSMDETVSQMIANIVS
ncbi:hypothetical protein niasHT_006156 [Heterodera trifolii]|uniref:Coatomer subunit gamma n=1 Tax=Heterodera trifolii TaxID=157864 RepID=A0ABD2M2A4_9BILA